MIRSLRTRVLLVARVLLLASVFQIPVSLNSEFQGQTVTIDRIPAEIRSCERLFESTGPREVRELPGFADADDIGRPAKLRIGHYNLQQYKVFKDANDGAVEPKSDWAKRRIAVQIKREDPDVLFVSEVVGEQSLSVLAESLGGVYDAQIFEGNDKYSMIAILIRKTLPFRVTFQSYRAIKHVYNHELVPVFTRDLVVADLTYPGDSYPTVSIAGSHFKSNRTTKFTKSFDDHSTKKRFEQAQTAVQVLQKHQNEVHSLGMILTGDYNADIGKDAELSPIRNNGFTDVMSIANVPAEDRGTHVYIQKYYDKSHSKILQFDGMFVSREFVSSGAIESAGTVPEHDDDGKELPQPKTREELQTHSSDHNMVLMTIDLVKLRAGRRRN